MKIIASLYSDPEYYPPTLNAVGLLAKHCEKIVIFSRNVKTKEWDYPLNVSLKRSGSFKTIREVEKASVFWKTVSFIKFTVNFYIAILVNKPNWVICYDPIPLFSYRIASFFLFKKPKLWYHNHDILVKSTLRKYSVSWFALKYEANMFLKIDLFSLPSKEREIYFPIDKLKGKYFFLANYPSLHNNTICRQIAKKNNFKLLYQGHIGEGHGLMEIIKYLKPNKLLLSIIGMGDIKYIKELNDLIQKLSLADRIKIYEPVPYQKLKQFTIQHDVGLAILLPKNINFKTASTSSNKIYEYIAACMPVIMFDNEDYKNNLSNRKWAFFTDLSDESLDRFFLNLTKNYDEYSNSARKDFETELNFERLFNPILHYLKI